MKANSCIFLVILFFFSLTLLYSDRVVYSFQLKSNEISHKGTNVMGVDIDYALMELEFDRPLYHYMSIACPNYTCPKPANNIDCTCDYTDALKCPKTVSGDPSCPTCPTTYNDRVGKLRNYCTDQNWTVINYNQDYTFNVSSGDPLYLRVKANSTGCQGTFLYATQKIGIYYMIMSPSPIYYVKDGRFIAEGLYRTRTNIGICPTDNHPWALRQSWTNDTYYIVVIAESDYATFSLTLYSGDVPAPVVSPSCVPISPNHTCINDGKAITNYSSGQLNNYFTYQVKKPEVVTIYCPSLVESMYIYVTDDTSNNTYPSVSNHKWGIYNGRDLYLTMKLTPLNNTTPRTLYINLFPGYDTNYSCVLTTTAERFLRPFTDNYGPGGTYLSMGNARLLMPNDEIIKSEVYDFTYTFTTLFPRLNNNPLWPVPTPLSFMQDAGDFNLFKFVIVDEYDNPPKPNTFQAAFILSLKQNSKVDNADFQELLASKIEFLNMVVDINGTALEGEFGFKYTPPKCNYQQFLNTVSKIDEFEDQTFNSTSYQDVATLRYSIDTYTLRDSWFGCQLQANDLLSTEVKNETQLTTACLYSASDLEYALDPCCNTTLEFFTCCTPKEMQVSVLENTGVKSAMVSDQCSSPDCTTSILGDYFNSVQSVNDGECALTYESLYFYQLDIVDTQRACTSVYEDTLCQNDTMCPNGIKCDLYQRRCLIPLKQKDKQYIECILRNSTETTIYFLKYQQNLTATDIPTLADQVYNAFLRPDCDSPYDLSHRGYYTYTSSSSYTDKCYPSPQCQDKTCVMPHDVCFDGYFGGWIFDGLFYYPNNTCNNVVGFCSDDMMCGDSTSCNSTCLQQPDFCGYCSANDTGCYDFSGTYATEQECTTGSSLCAYDDGYYADGLSDQQCKDSGRCSVSCGVYCSGYTTCVDTAHNISKTVCNTNNGTWLTNGVCIQPLLNPTQCAAKGPLYHYVNCSSMPVDSCYSPYGIDTVEMNLCRLKEIDCTTQQECEQSEMGGTCSDEYFFDPENSFQYPKGLGKCVHKHYVYNANWNIPTCEPFSENDSPVGCYKTVPEVFTKSQCEALPGYVWWTPSYNNRTACESKMGCEIMDRSSRSLMYSRRFNEMNQQECTSCLANSQHVWKNMFTWTPGVWYPGVPVQGEWMSPRFIHNGNFSNYFQSQRFSAALDQTYYSRMTNQLRSASLCRTKRLEQNLESISCSCSGPGGAECFTTSSMLLGQSNPCVNEVTTFQLSYGQLIFSPGSVSYACTNALISQVSRKLFKSSVTESLTSSFVSYRKPDNYELLNHKGATIGTILSDGIKVDVNQVTYYTICLESDDPKYPILDVVVAKGDTLTSTSKSDVLIPMNVHVFSKNGYLCGNVTVSSVNDNSTSTDNVNTYFIVSRVANYKDADKVLFDKSAKRLLNALAALFLIGSIWGIAQIIVSSYRIYNGKGKFKLVHALIITTTIFITIRSIYFFILPTGKLQSQVSDYILVVLPTFIYFTAFTQIIVLWYVIVKKKVTSNQNILRRLKRMILLVNIVLYLLFIIIVLVFNFTQKKVNNDCGGRLVVETNANTTPQRIVSIVYAIVQAAISLAIGAAFIYLGGTIYFMMQMRTTKLGVDSKSSPDGGKKSLTIVTWFCSIGFILHCVFVLVLVGAQPSNIVFSFIGLIITEILPALSILYSYNQARFGPSIINSIKLRSSQSGSTNSSSMVSSSSSSLNASSHEIVYHHPPANFSTQPFPLPPR